MKSSVLDAHSLAEAHLFLLANPCDSCGRGPVRGAEGTRIPDATEDRLLLEVSGRCDACSATSSRRFRLPPGVSGATAVINPTDEPSRILDVAQWLTLFRMIVEAADREKDKVQARHLGIEAAQCLEEALRFYGEDDAPDPSGFFLDSSRKHLAEHPQQFSRQRLLGLRAKLPTLVAMQATLSREPKKRPWWRPWSK